MGSSGPTPKSVGAGASLCERVLELGKVADNRANVEIKKPRSAASHHAIISKTSVSIRENPCQKTLCKEKFRHAFTRIFGFGFGGIRVNP